MLWPVTLSCITVSCWGTLFSADKALTVASGIDCLHLLQTCTAALVGWGNTHRFAILGDGAARDRNALAGEELGDAAVAQGTLGLFFLHELADLGAYGRRGGTRAVGAFDLAREEITQLEHATGSVHVLARSDARDGGFVHADGFGDVLEDHRPHVLIAMFQERLLTLDDRAGDLDQGLVANFQALQQPARLLQLRAHGRVAGIAPDQTGITAVQTHAWQGGRVDLHGPAVLGAPHEHIRYDIFCRALADRRSGPGVTGAYQRQRVG